MRYIGIDPGVGGGIAMIHEDGSPASVVKMPGTERDVFDHLRSNLYSPELGPCRAYLEYVRAMPKMGVASMFEFGRGYGALRMALTSLDIPFEEVTPQKWQRAIGCMTKGDKNVSKQKAQELFPGLKITHYIADALLLAEYGRRLRR